jgi:hypothetical protein
LDEPAVLINAPGANCAGYVISPPGFGRSWIAFPVSVVVVFGFSTLISGASLITVMSACAAVIFNVKLTVLVSPNPAATDAFTWSSNPGAWARTEYAPGRSSGKLNRPDSSVRACRRTPVSPFVTVTVAPPTAPPV